MCVCVCIYIYIYIWMGSDYQLITTSTKYWSYILIEEYCSSG